MTRTKGARVLPFRRPTPEARSRQTIDRLVEHVSHLRPIYRNELSLGDWIVVKTKNSVYTIGVLEDDTFSVSGGWFDAHDLSPSHTTINGCTWGGRAILQNVVATPGLLLEFGNHVTTTRIQDVRLIRGGELHPV